MQPPCWRKRPERCRTWCPAYIGRDKAALFSWSLRWVSTSSNVGATSTRRGTTPPACLGVSSRLPKRRLPSSRTGLWISLNSRTRPRLSPQPWTLQRSSRLCHPYRISQRKILLLILRRRHRRIYTPPGHPCLINSLAFVAANTYIHTHKWI